MYKELEVECQFPYLRLDARHSTAVSCLVWSTSSGSRPPMVG